MVVYSSILHAKTMFGSSLYPFVLSEVHVSLLLFVFIYAYSTISMSDDIPVV
jgi:hypothetical protein